MAITTLTATPKGFLSKVVALKQGEEEKGRIEAKWMREQGMLILEDRTWNMKCRKSSGNDFLLEDSEGRVVAEARKQGPYTDTTTITYGTMEFLLARPSVWKSGFTLSWSDEPIGTINRPRWSSRDIEITLPESLPLEVRAFIFWVVMVLWNRSAAAAAG